MFPKSGAPMETDAHFETLSISFGVPSKGALPPGSPHRAPSGRDAPSLEDESEYLRYNAEGGHLRSLNCQYHVHKFVTG